MRWLVLALITLTALAGCTDSTTPTTDDDQVFDDFGDDIGTGLGRIRGIVVDSTITPLADVTVTIKGTQTSMQTNENGAFQFDDLEPGPYFLDVSKVGYETIQSQTNVEADVASPDILRIQLVEAPGTEPMAFTLDQEGFIECNVGEPANDHDCSLAENQGEITFPIDGRPDWIQVEIQWESTQPAGTNLYVIMEVCDDCPSPTDSFGASPNKFDETSEAQSTYVARATPDFIDSIWTNGTMDLYVDVSSSGPAAGTGAVINQPIHVYATFFYNLPLDEGWMFTVDGDYEY